MNTYSHALLAAAIERPIAKRILNDPDRLPPVRMSALIVGSFIPDFLLTALAIIFIIRDTLVGAFENIDFEQMESGSRAPQEWLDASLTMRLFDDWFFNNPWIISIQNLFHSPLLLIIYLTVTYWLWKSNVKWSGWFFWLAAAAMLHTILDIPLHVDDGPLLLFPLNWEWRFESPISYWDPQYFGREWSTFESVLDVGLISYLLWIYRMSLLNWFKGILNRGKTTGKQEDLMTPR